MKTKISQDDRNNQVNSQRMMMARSSSYDQFTFMDSLTNRTIAVKDMRRMGRKKMRVKGKVRASS